MARDSVLPDQGRPALAGPPQGLPGSSSPAPRQRVLRASQAQPRAAWDGTSAILLVQASPRLSPFPPGITSVKVCWHSNLSPQSFTCHLHLRCTEDFYMVFGNPQLHVVFRGRRTVTTLSFTSRMRTAPVARCARLVNGRGTRAPDCGHSVSQTPPPRPCTGQSGPALCQRVTRARRSPV